MEGHWMWVHCCMRQYHLAFPEFKTSRELRICCKWTLQDAAGASQSWPCPLMSLPAAEHWLCSESPSWWQPTFPFWDVWDQFLVWQSDCHLDEKLLLCPVNPCPVFGLCCFLRWAASPLLGQGTQFSLHSVPVSQNLFLPAAELVLLPGFKN